MNLRANFVDRGWTLFVKLEFRLATFCILDHCFYRSLDPSESLDWRTDVFPLDRLLLSPSKSRNRIEPRSPWNSNFNLGLKSCVSFLFVSFRFFSKLYVSKCVEVCRSVSKIISYITEYLYFEYSGMNLIVHSSYLIISYDANYIALHYN